jgi:putative phosphoesterase
LKIAAVYDVHAMPLALEAALRAAEHEGAEVVLFGGDLIHGPCPGRAVELARAVPGARFVRGNCDREPDGWDVADLDRNTLDWLAELPLTQSIDGVLYCHATPTDDMPMTTAITPDDVLRSTFGGLEERVVVVGHTHHQFDRAVEGVRVVNAGSVGMPYEDDVAAFWALVDEGEPSLRRTPLDVEAAAAEIRASGWPSAEEFVTENLLSAQSREAAIAYFENRRT